MLKIRTNKGNVYFMTADELIKFAYSLKCQGGYTVLAFFPEGA